MTNFSNPSFSVHRPRIGIIQRSIPVTVNRCIHGILADIGPDGISVVTEFPVQVGTRISAEFETLGQHVQGEFEVQFMRIMPNGHIRSRLRLVESGSCPAGLQLEQLTSLLQHHRPDTQPQAA